MADIIKMDIMEIDLESGVIARSFCTRTIGSADAKANAFGVRAKRNGESVDLSGYTVRGFFHDAAGNNVMIDTGNYVGNDLAYVVLPALCYNNEGQFVLAIKLEKNDVKETVRIVDGVVSNTFTDSPIAPSETVPTYEDIIEMYEDYEASQARALKTDSTIITGDGTQSEIENHSNVKGNTVYRMQLTAPMSWLPSGYPTNAETLYLLQIAHQFGANIGILEIIFDEKINTRWFRNAQPAQTYGPWVAVTEDVRMFNDIITGDGTQSAIANHNNVKLNTMYRLQLTTKMSWLPSEYPTTANTYFLMDVAHPFSGSYGIAEIIYDENMVPKWARQAQPFGTFGEWHGFVNGRMQINCPAGTNVIQGKIELAEYVSHADVILGQGEHVITSFSGNGMSIGNDVRVIGRPGAVIKAENTEPNQYFSVFYAGKGDFELQGVKIIGKNIRYCVHDDPPSSYAGTPARHVYRECNFYIDNRQNTLWGNHQCIGGGMGLHTTIIVENSDFSAANPVSELGLVSYHNNGAAGAEGAIYIKDSKFRGAQGTARFGWYGQSQEITPCYVMNCSLGTEPVIRSETGDSSSPYENMTLDKWGNEIRGN